MLTGFNTNIEHNGRIFHVQTEVQGGSHPIVETLVYEGGTIINSKKTPYDHLLQTETPEKAIRQLVEKQHIIMISLVKAGKYGHQFDRLRAKDVPVSKTYEAPSIIEHKELSETSPATSADQDNPDHEEIQITEKIQLKRELSPPDDKYRENAIVNRTEIKEPVQENQKAGEKEKKYVSGANIKRSGFLEKIVEQTDRLQLVKITRDLEIKNILILKMKAILDELEFLLEDIQAVAIHLKTYELDIVSPNEQKNRDFFILLSNALSSVHEALTMTDLFGDYAEHIITTPKAVILIFIVTEDCFLSVAANPYADIDSIRLAIEPLKKQVRDILNKNLTK